MEDTDKKTPNKNIAADRAESSEDVRIDFGNLKKDLGSFALAKNPHCLFGTVSFLLHRLAIAPTRLTFLTVLIQGVIPPVFGLLKRGGKVFVTVVASCSRAALMPIIEGKVLEGSTIYSVGWKAYDGLILNGYDHYRVFHSKNEFVRGKSHINGIEAFWSFAKRRLAQFNGIQEDKFILHLAECQFRYNNRNKNLRNVLVNEYAMLV